MRVDNYPLISHPNWIHRHPPLGSVFIITEPILFSWKHLLLNEIVLFIFSCNCLASICSYNMISVRLENLSLQFILVSQHLEDSLAHTDIRSKFAEGVNSPTILGSTKDLLWKRVLKVLRLFQIEGVLEVTQSWQIFAKGPDSCISDFVGLTVTAMTIHVCCHPWKQP